MPGNGVPAYRRGQGWTYKIGTSYSTPILATLAFLVMDRYADGAKAASGSYVTPSISKVYDILKNSAQYTSHVTELGWGVVDFAQAYNSAYNMGFGDYYVPCNPFC